MSKVIQALIDGDYIVKRLGTDYSGCYKFITLPTGETGHVTVYDSPRYGTTPPVHRGVVNVCNLKFSYEDAGYDQYLPNIYWVDEDPKYEDEGIIVDGYCNFEIDGIENTTSDSDNLMNRFKDLFINKFCTDDTWDDVPDDCLGDEAVDIEDCNLIEVENQGIIHYKDEDYYIVDGDTSCEDEVYDYITKHGDKDAKFVYAVASATSINEEGRYEPVYIIGYKGALDSSEVVYLCEKEDLSYNSVNCMVE